MQINRQAFTLIELLVVVLIIGILAAIAVPQYRLVVEKARATEAITLVHSLQKAIDLYIFENGYSDVSFLGNSFDGNGKLMVDLESINCADMGGYSCKSKYFEYRAECSTVGGGYCGIHAFRRDGESDDWEDYMLDLGRGPGISGDDYSVKWRKLCLPGPDSPSYAVKLCKSFEEIYGQYKW